MAFDECGFRGPAGNRAFDRVTRVDSFGGEGVVLPPALTFVVKMFATHSSVLVFLSTRLPRFGRDDWRVRSSDVSSGIRYLMVVRVDESE